MDLVANELATSHGFFAMYYGSEFFSKAMDTWAYRNGLRLDFIRPGEPVENAYIESFNGRLRGERLNFEIYLLDRGCSPKLLASSV